MTKNRDLKVHVRKRMEKTGESYATALRHVEAASKQQPEQPAAKTAEPATQEPPTTGLALRAGGLRHSWQATYRTEAPMDGWFVLGMNRDDHEVTVDRTQGHSTSSSALIRSRDSSVTSPTLVTQHFLAHDYHGQRLRLSAWLKCEDVTRSALLWMLLEDNTRLLLFTTATPVTGTTDWTRREIVYDIDTDATLISIGFELGGAGAAWLADVAVDVVGTEVRTTGSRQLPSKPKNLSFDE
jgi:hypothetical protein